MVVNLQKSSDTELKAACFEFDEQIKIISMNRQKIYEELQKRYFEKNQEKNIEKQIEKKSDIEKSK